MSMGQKNRPKTRSRLENALGPCTVVVPYANPLDVLAAANKLSTQPTPSVSIPHEKKWVYTTLDKVKDAYKKQLEAMNMYALATWGSDTEKDIMNDVILWLQNDPEGTEESLIDEVVQRCKKFVNTDSANAVLKHLQGTGNVTLDNSGNVSYNFPFRKSKTLTQYISYFSDHTDHNPAPSESDDKSGDSSEELGTLLCTSACVLHHLYQLAFTDTCMPLSVSRLLEVMEPVCNMLYTVPPSRIFSMNMKTINHRQVKDKASKTNETSKKQQTSDKQESKSTSKPKMKMEFAIGVFPGENNIQEQITITPEGLTGIEVSVTETSPDKPCTKTMTTPDKRLRAVGQCKRFTKYLRSRLTIAARSHNAILVPTSEQEEKDMISKVSRWVNSVQGQAVTNLHQMLVNICIGKVRHLTPSTITDLLKKSGNITIDDKQSVTYQLPTNQDKKPSWQEDTITAATESCRCSGMLKKAFQTKKRKARGKKEKSKCKN